MNRRNILLYTLAGVFSVIGALTNGISPFLAGGKNRLAVFGDHINTHRRFGDNRIVANQKERECRLTPDGKNNARFALRYGDIYISGCGGVHTEFQRAHERSAHSGGYNKCNRLCVLRHIDAQKQQERKKHGAVYYSLRALRQYLADNDNRGVAGAPV